MEAISIHMGFLTLSIYVRGRHLSVNKHLLGLTTRPALSGTRTGKELAHPISALTELTDSNASGQALSPFMLHSISKQKEGN